ncbi:hypothetical protein L218DRAFT_95414 [Marasmius fiardii PR-910]|nr:hypothetical protein L218DRAFT_95414 [Marasmius fiardii PR-910]
MRELQMECFPEKRETRKNGDVMFFVFSDAVRQMETDKERKRGQHSPQSQRLPNPT